MTSKTPSQICSLGIALQKRRAVLYGDMISARLQEFFKLLESFVKVCNLMEKIRSPDMPAMLKEICHPTSQGGRFPAGIREVCKDFLEVRFLYKGF